MATIGGTAGGIRADTQAIEEGFAKARAIMAKHVAGHKLAALAAKLAPGRGVTNIAINIPVDGLATAVVTVLLDQDDVPELTAVVDGIEPDAVTIVEKR